MRKATFLFLATLLSFVSFAQNPYEQFGYHAPKMPELEKKKVEEVNPVFLIVNRDTSNSIRRLEIDQRKGRVAVYSRNNVLIAYDTLEECTMLRWMTPDPYAQHYSPYVAMSNNAILYVDSNGGFDTKVGAWLWKTFNGGGDIGYDEERDFYYVSQVGKNSEGEYEISMFSGHDPSRAGIQDNSVSSNWDVYTGSNLEWSTGWQGKTEVEAFGAKVGFEGNLGSAPMASFEQTVHLTSWERSKLDFKQAGEDASGNQITKTGFSAGAIFGGGVETERVYNPTTNEASFNEKRDLNLGIFKITDEFHNGELVSSKVGMNFGFKYSGFEGLEGNVNFGFIHRPKKKRD